MYVNVDTSSDVFIVLLMKANGLDTFIMEAHQRRCMAVMGRLVAGEH